MTYYVTASDGTYIAYDCMGDGSPIVLIHGFGASRTITWANTGWYQTLMRAGHKVIAIDCRGHGESQKPHAPADYDEGRMAMDIVAVLADLEIPESDVMGYSMGAQLAIRLMHDAPYRVRRAVLGGIGESYFHTAKELTETIARGLLAKDPSKITDPIAREFRIFCERAHDDLAAMAACMRRPRRIFSPDELHAMPQKALVVCGAEDNMSGPPEPLARAFVDAQLLIVPKRNHHSTVGDPAYKDAVVAFLAHPG
jgi:pimeloyl-ACP methyl ester carboxylesterase